MGLVTEDSLWDNTLTQKLTKTIKKAMSTHVKLQLSQNHSIFRWVPIISSQYKSLQKTLSIFWLRSPDIWSLSWKYFRPPIFRSSSAPALRRRPEAFFYLYQNSGLFLLIENYLWKASCNSQGRSFLVSIYLQFVLSTHQGQSAFNIYEPKNCLAIKNGRNLQESAAEDTIFDETWVGKHGVVCFIF